MKNHLKPQPKEPPAEAAEGRAGGALSAHAQGSLYGSQDALQAHKGSPAVNQIAQCASAIVLPRSRPVR